jgi:hypothetical protein
MIYVPEYCTQVYTYILSTTPSIIYYIMYYLKLIIILIIITISKSLIQYLSNIPGKSEIKELKKQPHWGLHTCYGMC